jgi:hypothetical protein
MIPLIIQALRSWWLAVAVHLGIWLLLFLAVSKFGGSAPPYKDSVALTTPAQSPAPVAKLEHLTSSGIYPTLLPNSNEPSLFFTKHFIPPPAPAAPAPTTMKIDVTYSGYFDAQDSPRQVFVKLAQAIVVEPVGAHITTNWFIGAAAINSLTLTNLAGKTTVLPLNAKTEIEVPIR